MVYKTAAVTVSCVAQPPLHIWRFSVLCEKQVLAVQARLMPSHLPHSSSKFDGQWQSNCPTRASTAEVRNSSLFMPQRPGYGGNHPRCTKRVMYPPHEHFIRTKLAGLHLNSSSTLQTLSAAICGSEFGVRGSTRRDLVDCRGRHGITSKVAARCILK